MSYVLTCGDDGVQINEGTRLGLLGAGLKLPQAEAVVTALKKTFPEAELSVAASAENDWVRREFKLDDYEQADATMQQQLQAMADSMELGYAGFLPFADPRQLKHGIKGHMVRPKGIHIANKICFTLGGGEQVFNLGHYVVSADWLSNASEKVAAELMRVQMDFYKELAKGRELVIVFEMGGELGEDVAKANLAVLEKLGIKGEILEPKS